MRVTVLSPATADLAPQTSGACHAAVRRGNFRGLAGDDRRLVANCASRPRAALSGERPASNREGRAASCLLWLCRRRLADERLGHLAGRGTRRLRSRAAHAAVSLRARCSARLRPGADRLALSVARAPLRLAPLFGVGWRIYGRIYDPGGLCPRAKSP